MQFRYKEAKHDRYDHYPHFKNLQLDTPEAISLTQQTQLQGLLGIPFVIVYFMCVTVYLTRQNPDTELFDVLWNGSIFFGILSVMTLASYKIFNHITN